MPKKGPNIPNKHQDDPDSNGNENKPARNGPAAPKTSGKFGKLFLLSAIFGGVISFYVYKLATTPPDMPKYGLDEWWGPYPIDQQKDTSIQPFKIEFSDYIVNDLKERLLHRRPFAAPLDNTGFTYGFNSNFLTQVLDYWQNKYNFKDRENFLNKYKHYKTKIQGLDIHFMHVKPQVETNIAVVPLLMLHGWPGSIREFYEIIPMLTKVNSKHQFVFEIIAPSLPGYGYSQGAARPGLGPVETAVVLRNLMRRIGHDRFYVQGSGSGHFIGSALATLFPRDVIGFHTNMPVVASPFNIVVMLLGSIWPSLIVEPEVQNRMYPLSEHIPRYLEESGYMHIHLTKPDTIGTALSDSPAGLAAYILEKFSTWTNPEYKQAADGKLLEKYQLTHLLDNVMIYWVTNSITTSIRTHAELFNKRALDIRLDDIPTPVPTWGIKFKHELVFSPDCLLRRKYLNYFHSTMVEDGGHFAAMEMPEILADDIFNAVDTFRKFREETTNVHPSEAPTVTVYNFTAKNLNGELVSLRKYKGYVLLIVNVASSCSLTDVNYIQLNELHDKYAKSGLRILAFPCNQFAQQEPGSTKDILKFTGEKGVKFDVFEKIEVNGKNAHPLYKFLKSSQSGTLGDFIKWNFSKFLVDKNGVPVARFGPQVNPRDIENDLRKYL